MGSYSNNTGGMKGNPTGFRGVRVRERGNGVRTQDVVDIESVGGDSARPGYRLSGITRNTMNTQTGKTLSTKVPVSSNLNDKNQELYTRGAVSTGPKSSKQARPDLALTRTKASANSKLRKLDEGMTSKSAKKRPASTGKAARKKGS